MAAKPAPAPVSVPSSIDGKPATATHFALTPQNSSKAVPIQPVSIPSDIKWDAPKVAVQAATPGGEKAVVTYVGDGDGAQVLKKDGSQLNCRIDTIDAPEIPHQKYGKPGQPFGEEARRTLQSLIDKKEVTVTVTKPASEGKYGRSYCKIEVEGQNIDQKMLQAGAAWLYRRYTNDPKLDKLEAEAKAAKRGLWANPNPENPEDFRNRYR